MNWHSSIRSPIFGTALALHFLAVTAIAQGDDSAQGPLHPARAVSWRSVGPAVMSGRIVDLAVPEQDPTTIYVASASGGLWKTTNRGTTWTPIFDTQPTQTLGDVAVAPSDPAIVWAGTGEANNQRSSYAGAGVFKSTDGGKSWTGVGLRDSHHIGRIVIHPSDPETVFVAVLGHLYSPNKERGLYRTKDGGKSWELVLGIDEDTGVVDVVMDPERPEILFAASYQRRRRAWHFTEAGPGSGIWKSEDGGTTWKRLEGGLPRGEIGRIGLAMSPRNPETLYACVENRNPESDRTPSADDPTDERNGELKDREPGGSEAEAGTLGAPVPPKLAGGEIYRTVDGGLHWRRMNEKPVSGEPPYYYGQIRIDPADDERVWLLGVPLFHSEDGGKTWQNDGARGIHSDHHALWIDPRDSDHMLDGNDGGLAVTWDRGKTWDVFPNLPLAQFYTVCVDRRTPYRIYGGIQDNGSFGMPSVGALRSGIQDWEGYRINSGDGFCCAVDPEDLDIVYSESQFGRASRLNLRTHERKNIRPPRGRGEAPMRCNWMTPLLLSPHNPRIVYFASQRLYRSLDRGDSWEVISPDLTTNDPEKIKGNVPHCTITTVAESPLRPGVLWAGTDDGKVQVSQDGGRHWRDVSDHFPGEVRGLWVSRVVASAHEKGRAWVSFTGYREDRFEPYVFLTDDYGGTWTPLSHGLPRSPVNVLVEDSKNPDLVFAGTDAGVWTSLDAGDSWEKLDRGLPAAAVTDLALAEEAGDLVAATHGRGFFVAHVEPLRQLTSKARQDDVFLCRPAQPVMPDNVFSRGFTGARFFEGKNPEPGVRIAYFLKSKPEGQVSLEIQTADGRRVRRLNEKDEAGLNLVTWDLRGTVRGNRDLAGPSRGRRGGLNFRGGPPVPAGDYVVVLKVGDRELRERVTVPASLAASVGIREVDREEYGGRGDI